MLTDREFEELETQATEYVQKDEVDESMQYETIVADDEVEVNMFPLDNETLTIEVHVDDDAEWHEELTANSSGNLSNGGPMYQALDDELEEAIENATNRRPAFTARKGSHWFSAEVKH